MTDRREFPIIFSAAMVRAILEGRKTQTRRLAYQAVKTYPGVECSHGYDDCPACDAPKSSVWLGWHEAGLLAPPNGMWGRETWRTEPKYDSIAARYLLPGSPLLYECDDSERGINPEIWGKLRPSIHMPRWASRLTLPFTAESRVERLQEISVADCYQEGIERPRELHLGSEVTARQNARVSFARLWNSLHKPPFAWEDNPYVVVLTFTRSKSWAIMHFATHIANGIIARSLGARPSFSVSWADRNSAA